jgi:hypothetical protein
MALKGLNEYRSQMLKEHYVSHEANIKNTLNSSILKIGQNQSANVKKNPNQKVIKNNGVIGSSAHATFTSTIMPKAFPESQEGSSEVSRITVPSPIPKTGLKCSKPNNPLSAQSFLNKNTHPTSKAKVPYSSSKPTIPSDLVSTKNALIQGLGNPLVVSNTSSSYSGSKTLSPPNPLKGMSSDHFAAPSKNFPKLPTQISVNDDSGNVVSKRCHSTIRKVKVESDR